VARGAYASHELYMMKTAVLDGRFFLSEGCVMADEYPADVLAGAKAGCRSPMLVVGGLIAVVMLFCVFPLMVMVLLLWLDPSTNGLLSDVLTGLRATPLP